MDSLGTGNTLSPSEKDLFQNFADIIDQEGKKLTQVQSSHAPCNSSYPQIIQGNVELEDKSKEENEYETAQIFAGRFLQRTFQNVLALVDSRRSAMDVNAQSPKQFENYSCNKENNFAGFGKILMKQNKFGPLTSTPHETGSNQLKLRVLQDESPKYQGKAVEGMGNNCQQKSTHFKRGADHSRPRKVAMNKAAELRIQRIQQKMKNMNPKE